MERNIGCNLLASEGEQACGYSTPSSLLHGTAAISRRTAAGWSASGGNAACTPIESAPVGRADARWDVTYAPSPALRRSHESSNPWTRRKARCAGKGAVLSSA